ncbi:hypothetical protein EDD16DRAFT_1518343 [Pisolithus croceorrhizus]|nr:hypothetical protein EDD16DRAFT_1518343 [Pisolithus croceorrhizus]
MDLPLRLGCGPNETSQRCGKGDDNSVMCEKGGAHSGERISQLFVVKVEIWGMEISLGTTKSLIYFIDIWLGEVEDIVTQHCQCNCGLHLPDNAQLTAIYNQQTPRASCHTSHSAVDDQTSPSTDVPIPAHPPSIIPSATSGKMSDGNSDLSQLQFYPTG